MSNLTSRPNLSSCSGELSRGGRFYLGDGEISWGELSGEANVREGNVWRELSTGHPPVGNSLRTFPSLSGISNADCFYNGSCSGRPKRKIKVHPVLFRNFIFARLKNCRELKRWITHYKIIFNYVCGS